MNWLKQHKILFGLIILLVVLILPAIYSLFRPGFFQTDDGNWMIIRFSAFYQALSAEQFPPRFLGRLNFGYGYPVANFLYPGFMYLATPFKVVGFGYIESIKIVLGLTFIFSGIFTFLWLRKLFGDIAAFFGALFYVYAPYHLYDLTKRGSVGELLSMSVIPFVLWQIENKNAFFLAIGIFLLIISHNTLALLFLPLAFLYALMIIVFSDKSHDTINKFIFAFTTGILMSAFFSFPAVFELSNTVFSKTKVSDFNKYFVDYNVIGITTFVIFIAAIFLFVIKAELIKKHRSTILMVIVGLVSIFFATFLSESVWSILPISFVQFPFRVLSITVLAGAFVFAFLVSEIKKPFNYFVGTLLIVATVFLSLPFIFPNNSNDLPDGFYSTNEATTTVLDEYMPVWVLQKPTSHAITPVEILKGEGLVNNISQNSKNINFDYVSESPSVIRVNTIYYPGWSAYSNGKRKAIFYDNEKGVMDLKLTRGNQNIVFAFNETPLRLFSDLISVAAFIILLAYPFRKKISKFINL